MQVDIPRPGNMEEKLGDETFDLYRQKYEQAGQLLRQLTFYPAMHNASLICSVCLAQKPLWCLTVLSVWFPAHLLVRLVM